MKASHLSLIFMLCLLACNKDKKKQFSYWKVNGVEYKSNNVTATIGERQQIAIMSSHDSVRFDFRFFLSFLPKSGNWPLLTINPNNNPNYAALAFYFDTIPYAISQHNTNRLIASDNNGKASYTLAPTWFYRYYNPNDSVLIEGTFNEP